MALEKLYECEIEAEIGQFDDFGDFLESIKKGEGERYKKGKVIFAERVCPNISANNIKGKLDFEIQIRGAVRDIMRWNGRECNNI